MGTSFCLMLVVNRKVPHVYILDTAVMDEAKKSVTPRICNYAQDTPFLS